MQRSLIVLMYCAPAMFGCKDDNKDGGDGASCPSTAGSDPITDVHLACDAQQHLLLQMNGGDSEPLPTRGLAFLQATSQPDDAVEQAAENHTLALAEHDSCEGTTRLERSLETEQSEPTETGSMFTCSELDAGELTIALAATDETDTVLTCIVVGHDPLGLVNALYYRAVDPLFDTTSCVQGVPRR